MSLFKDRYLFLVGRVLQFLPDLLHVCSFDWVARRLNQYFCTQDLLPECERQWKMVALKMLANYRLTAVNLNHVNQVRYLSLCSFSFVSSSYIWCAFRLQDGETALLLACKHSALRDVTMKIMSDRRFSAIACFNTVDKVRFSTVCPLFAPPFFIQFSRQDGNTALMCACSQRMKHSARHILKSTKLSPASLNQVNTVSLLIYLL